MARGFARAGLEASGMREPTLPQFDVETYLMWESRQAERYELQHGFVVAFAGGTLDHDRIAFNLRKVFDRLYPAPCRTFGSDVKVRVAHDTLYYPDAGVVCDELPGTATIVERPTVVAEVLSTSTRAYDLIEKRAAYRNVPSLRAYVVVHVAVRHIDLDVRRADGTWVTVPLEEGTHPLGNGELATDEVYERTSIAP